MKRQARNAVTIARRSHLFPYRTQKLSSLALMILGGRLPGKVGRCRFSKKRSSRKRTSFFISARDSWRNLECSLTANNIADLYQMASYVSFCAFSAFLFREIILHAVLAVGQVILSVIHTGRSTSIPLKNDFSRILNPVLSIQDAYDQDQGIFSVFREA